MVYIPLCYTARHGITLTYYRSPAMGCAVNRAVDRLSSMLCYQQVINIYLRSAHGAAVLLFFSFVLFASREVRTDKDQLLHGLLSPAIELSNFMGQIAAEPSRRFEHRLDKIPYLIY